MSFVYRGNYINGEFKKPPADQKFSKLSPSDFSDSLLQVECSSSVVREACEAGKKAFLPWLQTPLEKRKQLLLNLKKIYEKRSAELAEVIARETGKPLWESQGEANALKSKVDITLKESLQLVQDQKVNEEASIRFQARGLMLVIGPFNFPMHLANGQILSALLVGNTVIFKPSEKTPTSGQIFAECFHEAGFPKAVFQMIQGAAEVSQKLCTEPLVDGILFTGSYSVGQKIKEATLDQYWKILALEMGGKNSAIIWDYHSKEDVCLEILKSCFFTAGQRCSSASRIILNKKKAAELLPLLKQAGSRIKVGHWKDNPFMGALIDSPSEEKFFKAQEKAEKEGAEFLLKGEKRSFKDFKGHYVSPSLYQLPFDPESSLQSEELFSPQVTIYLVDSLEEALSISNHSGYGLVLSFFSEDPKLQEEVYYKSKVGLLNYNQATCGASPYLPFGGRGRSGNDRPGGIYTVHSCVIPVAQKKGKVPSFSKEKAPSHLKNLLD